MNASVVRPADAALRDLGGGHMVACHHPLG